VPTAQTTWLILCTPAAAAIWHSIDYARQLTPTILFHIQGQNLETELFPCPGQSCGTVYRQQFVTQTICIFKAQTQIAFFKFVFYWFMCMKGTKLPLTFSRGTCTFLTDTVQVHLPAWSCFCSHVCTTLRVLEHCWCYLQTLEISQNAEMLNELIAAQSKTRQKVRVHYKCLNRLFSF